VSETPNESIALQMAWQQSIGADPSCTSDRSFQRFFGFVEGKTGLHIPRQWEAYATNEGLSKRYSASSNLMLLRGYEGSLSTGARKIHNQASMSCGIQMAAGKRIEQDGNSTRIIVEGQSYRFQGKGVAEIVGSKAPGGVFALTMCDTVIDKGECFVVLYNDFGETVVLALAANGQTVLWSRQGNYRKTRYRQHGPPPSFECEIATSRRLVALFGCDLSECLFEAWDRKTGEPIYSFSTMSKKAAGKPIFPTSSQGGK
jgi:hypothetical protein